MLIEIHKFLQSHDISMTTPSNLSIIMEIKLWTIDKFSEMDKMHIELVRPSLFTTTGGCSWRK